MMSVCVQCSYTRPEGEIAWLIVMKFGSFGAILVSTSAHEKIGHQTHALPSNGQQEAPLPRRAQRVGRA